MRCYFCGYDNPQGKNRCEKCGRSLISDDESAKSSVYKHPTNRKPDNININMLKETEREKDSISEVVTLREDDNRCPECGYMMEKGACSNCGYDSKSSKRIVSKMDVDDKNEKYNRKEKELITGPNVRDTKRPDRKGKKKHFTLTPISEETGEAEGIPILFKGKEVILNRANTSPQNDTISSGNQAVICCNDGIWSIEDKSEFKTTFVQAAYKIELHNGDLILLGDQLYRFDIQTK